MYFYKADLKFSAHLWFKQFDNDAQYDYVDLSIGVYRPFKGIDISLTYYDMDVSDGGLCCDSHNNRADRLDVAVSGAF
tara:strand:+ start:473 stop:706 length:234 start_codon:yes stop_codon:yes gene_type:complete